MGGLKQSDFGTPNVYYFGDVSFDGSTQAKDNAFFFSLVNGFLILPFDVLQQVPLSINLGVLGHEYTHRVFNYRVFDNALFPPVLLNWSSGFAETPGLNLLKSLDEGLADTFGTGVTCAADLSTCNPEFIGLSLPPPHPDARRLDKPHCMTQALQTSMLSSTGGTFTGTASQYVVGTILGSSLWRAANDAAVVQKLTVGEARKQLYQGLYRSLAGGGTGTGIRELVAAAVNDQSQFRLDTTPTTKGVLDVFVEGMTDPLLKSSVCSAFMDRFGYSLADLKSCPATAKSYNDCPR